MILGSLTVNRDRSCFQVSVVSLRGHDAGGERVVHGYATVRDDSERAGALPSHKACS